jgi:hypothetical protein
MAALPRMAAGRLEIPRDCAGATRANCPRMTMRTLRLLIAITAGCSKKDDGDKSSKTTDTKADKKDEAKPEPFKGKLTEDVLKKANRAISVYTPDGQPADFAPTLEAAKLALGEPTHVDGTTYAWGFSEGDKCTYYVLNDKGGKADSGGVQSIDKAMTSMHGKCMAAIGANK